MNNMAYDSLNYARKLKRLGVPEKQANAHAQVLAEFKESHLATKDDINELRTEMQEMGALIRSEAKDTEAAIRSDMKDMETGIRSDMKDLNTTVLLLKTEFETFKIYISEKIKSSELGMKVFVGLTVYSGIIALGYYQKFFLNQ